ncbi:hypothetical protein [Ruegeria sp. SCP11]|uniref:hypothetical protein n=1 Tax=Ruegeria sp. SCP11 TaxID=3141378 RepID=UPI00333C4FF1
MAEWTFSEEDVITDESSGETDSDILYSNLESEFQTLIAALGLGAESFASTEDDDTRASTSTDTYVAVKPTGVNELNNVFLSDSAGDLFDGEDSGLDLTGGGDIDLYSDLADVNTVFGTFYDETAVSEDDLGKYVFGIAPDGSIAFILFLDQTGTNADGDTYKVQVAQFQPIDNTDFTDPDDPEDLDGVLHISAEEGFTIGFGNAPSSNVLWISFGEEDDGDSSNGEEIAIVATGRNPNHLKLQDGDTTNTSQGGILEATLGTNIQGLVFPNALYMTYVTGLSAPIAGNFRNPNDFKDENNLDFDGMFNVTGAKVQISQAVGSETQGARLTAMRTDVETGANFFTELGLAGDLDDQFGNDDTAVAITGIKVVNFLTGDLIVEQNGIGMASNGGVTVEIKMYADPGGGASFQVAEIFGFDAGMEFVFSTKGSDPTDDTHNRVLIEALSGNWDPGAFGFEQSQVVPENLDGIIFEDAGPTASVSAVDANFDHELDETVDPDGNDTSDGMDTYAAGDTVEVPPNGDLDDVYTVGVANEPPLVTIGTASADAIGRLTTTPGTLQGLFTVGTPTFDADGAGDLGGDGQTETLSFDLSLDGVATNYIATPLDGGPLDGTSDTFRTVHLVKVSDTVVEGRLAGSDGIDGAVTNDEYVAFRITINMPTDLANATLTTEQFIPIVHGSTSLFDENLEMTLATGETLGLKLTVVAEDGDDDTDTKMATSNLIDDSGGYLSVDDDGPQVSVSAQIDTGEFEAISKNLDETIGTDVYGDNDIPDGDGDSDEPATPPAIGEKSTGNGEVAALFTAPSADFGTDGPGALGSGSGTTDTLGFVDFGDPILTTVVATATGVLSDDNAADRAVYMIYVSSTIIEFRADTGDDNVLILKITLQEPNSPATAKLLYQQFAAVEHATTGETYDEVEQVLVDGTEGVEDILELQWTAEAQDGDEDKDTATAKITLIDKVKTVLSVDDDGPQTSASAIDANFDHELDETVDPDGDDTSNEMDTYASGEGPEVPPNGDTDDVYSPGPVANEPPVVTIGTASADAIGRLTTTAGVLQGLFTVGTPDFGTDGAGDLGGDGQTETLSFDLSLDGVATNYIATPLDGGPLDGTSDTFRTVHLVKVSDTVVEGRLAGSDGIDGAVTNDEYVAFRITINMPNDLAAATLTTEQFIPIVHGNTSLFDENLEMTLATGETLGLKVTVVAEDGDDDTDTVTATSTLIDDSGGYLSVDDDGPQTSVSAIDANFDHELDETVDPDGDDTSNEMDTYASGEGPEVPPNGDTDDVYSPGPVANEPPVVTIGTASADAIGRLTTTAGVLQGLFTVGTPDFGTDGAGDLGGDGQTETLSFDLSLDGVATNYIATPLDGGPLDGTSDTFRTVHLVKVSDTVVEGRLAGSDGIDGAVTNDEYVAFRITINSPTNLAAATLTTEQFIPIVHGDTSLYDENLEMTLATGETLGLKLTVVAEEGDDDTHTVMATSTLIDDSGGYLSVDDDGPQVSVSAQIDTGEFEAISVNLDETLDPDPVPNQDGDDVYAAGDTPDDNGDLDEPGTGGAIGELSTGDGAVAALFTTPTVDFGTDGAGALNGGTGKKNTLSFVNFGGPILTTIVATAVGALADDSANDREVYMIWAGTDVIEFRADTGDENVLVLKITLQNPTDPATAKLLYQQFAAVENGDDSLFDEAVNVLVAGSEGAEDILELQWTAEAQDGDGDQDTATAKVTLIDKVKTVLSVDDDGPQLEDPADGPSAPPTPFTFALGAVTDGFAWVPGTDGGTLAFTDWELGDMTKDFPTDWEAVFGNITGTLSNNDTVLTFSGDANGGTNLFKVTLTDNMNGTASYTFDVLTSAPLILNEVDLSGFPSGNPVETITLSTTSGGSDVRFNGLLWSDMAIDLSDDLIVTEAEDRPDTDMTQTDTFNRQDNLNRDTNGFGVFQDASALMNQSEGMLLETFQPGTLALKPVDGVQFVLNQNGGTDDVRVYVEVANVGGVGANENHAITIDLTKGGQAATDNFTIITSAIDSSAFGQAMDWDDDGVTRADDASEVEAGLIVLDTLTAFNTVYYNFVFPDDEDRNHGVRIKEVNILEQSFLSDLQLTMDVTGTDGDDDEVEQSFSIFVDGNNDGVFS